MNSKNIKTVNFWTANGIKKANQILLYNFHNYNFDGTPSSVSYKLGFTEQILNEDETTIDRFVSLSEGSVIIPDEVVQTWGSDDEPIFTYTIQELGLTEI